MKVKSFIKLGHSLALVIDRTLLDVCDIPHDRPVALRVEDHKIVIERCDENQMPKRRRQAATKNKGRKA